MKKFIALFLIIMSVLGMLMSCNGDTQSTETKDINTSDARIFNTENIKRIILHVFGEEKGSEVPAENISEFTAWLGTFAIDKEAEDILPPGINNYYVEIEYLDGTTVKEGLDVIEVDGTAYYLKHAKYPDSFFDIISETSEEK